MSAQLLALLTVAVLLGAACGAGAAHWWGQRAGRDLPRTDLRSDDAALAILSALRSTVVIVDADDDVVRASAAAYGYHVVADDRVCDEHVASLIASARLSDTAVDDTITVQRGRVEGSGHFILYVRVAPLGGGNILVLIEDRTAAQRLEAMRRDFVANVSHELKTPVGAISLLAEIVEDNADAPEIVRDYAGRMRKEAQRLGLLVQEIIELSRLQDGDALAAPQEVEIDAVIADACDQVRVEASARDIDVVWGGQRGLRVRGDVALLTTAIRNLLDNAIRYSEPRTRVAVGVSLDRDDDSVVRIAVVDEGMGIPSSDHDRVFERFYRVDKARSRATGGTGLGLSIVKHVAADHGGRVDLWSAPGRGSTFTLVLPRMVEPPAPTSEERTQP